jgi:hypothetical protein
MKIQNVKIVVILLSMLFITAGFPSVFAGELASEPTIKDKKNITDNDVEVSQSMIETPVRSSTSSGTIYVNTSAIMQRTDLTAKQKNDLIQIILNHIKENYEPVVGAANVTVTNNASCAATANRTVNIDPGSGDPANSAWGRWAYGSNNCTVYLGVFMNYSAVNGSFKNANGTWNVTKLGNAMGHTAGHEIGHSYSVGHNHRTAPADDETDNRSKMTAGQNINVTTRTKTRFPLDNHSRDIIRNNWGRPPCNSITDYNDSVLMSHYWGPPSYTTNLADEWGTMDVALSVFVEMPGWYELGFLGVDTDNGFIDGNADFDFVYKSSLGVEGTDAQVISFLQTNHDATQWLLRATQHSPYPGEWFMLDDSQIILSDFIARPDGLQVARNIEMQWVEQGVYIAFDTLCFGEYSNIYNGFTYGLYTPPQPPVQTTFTLHQGWNQISFTVQPDDMMMSSIFQDLIDDETLIIVRDGGVGVLYPQYNIDTIGLMHITQGYKVKVSEDVILSVFGTPVSFPVYIPLRQGWTLMGYPLFESRDALSVLQQLIDQETLIQVLDGDNNRVFYDGTTWVNEIGNFEPGQGYYVKTTQQTSLALYASSPTPPIVIGPEFGISDIPVWFSMGGSEYDDYVLLDYLLDWGDGSDVVELSLYPGELTEIDHTYCDDGLYEITLAVFDPCTGEGIQSVFEIEICGDGCLFTVELYDSYGDGWNGGILDVIVNGIVVLESITLEDGFGPGVYEFFASTGDLVECIYTSGYWPEENSYYVCNPNGILMFADGQEETEPIGGSFIAECELILYPPTPPMILGPEFGFVGQQLEFLIGGSDYAGSDLIRYCIDWGYGCMVYTDYFTPGVVLELTYSWDYPGEYIIELYTETQNGLISEIVEHPIFISGEYTKQKNNQGSLTKTIP